MGFDDWWAKQEIFCGEGGMEAASLAWDAAMGFTAKRCIDIVLQTKHAMNAVEKSAMRIQNQFREELNEMD